MSRQAYELDGTQGPIERIDTDTVIYRKNGQIERIGMYSVSYHANGRIRLIGFNEVSYDEKGHTIQQIGHNPVTYSSNGRIKTIGTMRVYYRDQPYSLHLAKSPFSGYQSLSNRHADTYQPLNELSVLTQRKASSENVLSNDTSPPAESWCPCVIL